MLKKKRPRQKSLFSLRHVTRKMQSVFCVGDICAVEIKKQATQCEQHFFSVFCLLPLCVWLNMKGENHNNRNPRICHMDGTATSTGALLKMEWTKLKKEISQVRGAFHKWVLCIGAGTNYWNATSLCRLCSDPQVLVRRMQETQARVLRL